MMTANEIRRRFLDFFASKNHKIVESDSVVPKDDPTVLFTTAGMQQFKRQFLGQNVTYKRAATSQKCLRTDDLDKVGKTAFHHTFFEMLGNFSFGDYFKKDAITWAWEFLTDKKWMGIQPEKLWVSVYTEDDEAYNIWLNDIKVPKNRIVKLGDKSNFWPSEAKTKGPNGPCGPCSEIFYDYGVNEEKPCENDNCNPDCSCGRFSEVWNLVFTQFNRKEGGTLEPLPGKNIDTGMGFERLVAVVQGKKNNYETDLFRPILDDIDKEAKTNNYTLTDTQKNIIADHIRAIVFGIGDGVVPSNDGRNYVIKKLIIDSVDLAILAGAESANLYKLVSTVARIMNEYYPELTTKTQDTESFVKKIEESFTLLRKQKIPQLEQKFSANKNNPEELGKLFFFASGTSGIPIGTLIAIANSTGVPHDTIKKAEKLHMIELEEEKNRSRAGSKMTGDVFADAELKLDVPKTQFLGYNEFDSTGKILKIFMGNAEVKEAKKGDEIKIVLDKTCFYAESGGQIGDTGTIKKEGATIKISDTKKIADVFIHFGTVTEGTIKQNDTVATQMDKERRLSIMRNHTATHLLQSALRKVLGAHVQQQGSFVAEDRLRFDFTHPKGVEKEKLNEIEKIVNSYIQANDTIEKHVMPIQEAKKSGALAFFAEKYGETVRVVTVNGYSKEFCGGTHLDNTGEIGQFKITGEGAIAQGIRRVEAVTGNYVKAWLKGKEVQEEALAKTAQQKQLEKEQGELKFLKIKDSIDSIINESKNIGTINVIRHQFKDLQPDLLRKISDLIKQKVKSAVIALASDNNGSANVLIVVTDDLIKKNIKADDLIKEIAAVMNASGGGRPQMAQAGGKDASRLDAAFKKLEGLLKERS